MNTILTVDQDTPSDVSLVEQSLAGDRDAFGKIVARYQSSICALTYSACGNLARSEDLAQEVFITAWRKLGSLQEPARFKAWLYGIARHLVSNAFRRHQRNPLAGAQALEGAEPVSSIGEPDEQAITKEEETILWHVLSGMPEVYREPMVLFYRENESIGRVAEVLAISEDAVRQRLSRGRILLNQRVAGVVRNGLRRTRPTDAFAVAVIAALPVLAATTTAKGAVIGMVTTKSATSQASGWAGFFKSIGFFAGLVAIPAALGSLFGYLLGRDATGIPPRRESVVKFWRIFIGGLVLFLFCPLLLTLFITGFLPNTVRAEFLSAMTIWLGLAYPFVLGTLVFWRWQRRRPQAGFEASADPGKPVGAPVAEYHPKRLFQRTVALMTIAATGLLVFCYFDMHHNVVRLSPADLRDVINQSPAGDLTASVTVCHYRSLWKSYPETYRNFLIKRESNGRTTIYSSPVDDANVALLAQKGVSCPTYVQGRDFEVLGAPGRFLPFLAAFVLAISAIFLFKGRLRSRAFEKIL